MLIETINRIKQKTPRYFVLLRKIAIYIGSSCLAVIAINNQYSLEINDILISILKYILSSCVAIAGTATLTKV